eukprot:s370_g6.t1
MLKFLNSLLNHVEFHCLLVKEAREEDLTYVFTVLLQDNLSFFSWETIELPTNVTYLAATLSTTLSPGRVAEISRLGIKLSGRDSAELFGKAHGMISFPRWISFWIWFSSHPD